MPANFIENIDDNTKQGNATTTQYRVVGIVLFVISLSLASVRLVFYILSSQSIQFEQLPWIKDLIFSVVVQLLILLVFVFVFYKFKLGMSTRDILEFSNISCTNKTNIFLTIVLGFCVTIMASGVSVVWNIILGFLGYSPSVNGDYMPNQFSASSFAMYFICGAILPAICEEFAIRGGLLNVLKNRYNKKNLIIVMGLAFGLFHGYIVQFVYTALMGALLCWLTITMGSLIPAMIVHFVNNALSVIVSHAANYNWFKSSFIGTIVDTLSNNYWLAILLYILVCIVGVLLIRVINKINKNNFNKFVVSINSPNKLLVSLKDNVFFIGAIVVTSLQTIFTFVWGVY